MAIHLKLDELIRAVHGARNSMVDLEALSDEQLELLRNEFENLRKRAGAHEHPSSRAIAQALERRRSEKG